MEQIRLTHKQYQAAEILEDKETTELLFGGAAGGGKSAFGCMWLISMATRYPETRWLMGRSKLKTLKETTLNTFFDVASMLKIDYSYNAQMGIIYFPNGSEILLKDLFLYPSDPKFDSLGSLEISGAFIDEVNQITELAKDIVKSRIRYKLDEYDLIPKVFMSCNPAKNWVYTSFYKPSTSKQLPNHRKFIQALVKDNPHISEHYVSTLKTLDENSRQRLLYGNWEWDDSPDAMIDYRAIVGMWGNTHLHDKHQQLYITVDVARLGNDKSVIMVWQGLEVVHITSIPKNTINELEAAIKEIQNYYKVPHHHIIADEDGVGGGLVDYMGIQGFVNNSRAINGENYQNLKTQCYYHLAKCINQGQVLISTKDHKNELVEELEQVRSYKSDVDSKLRILPKEKVKQNLGRSCDFSDAMAMRMWFDLEGESGVVEF
jgi:hypothetical protein